MPPPALQLEELPDSPSRVYVDGSNALAPSEGGAVTLRFQITASDPEALEALRHARRSLLREEWTLGLDPDEPSLEDAVFSTAEVHWTVRPSQRDWCLRKVRELTARAQRSLPGPRQAAGGLPRR